MHAEASSAPPRRPKAIKKGTVSEALPDRSIRFMQREYWNGGRTTWKRMHGTSCRLDGHRQHERKQASSSRVTVGDSAPELFT
jgi:hypothetical protein